MNQDRTLFAAFLTTTTVIALASAPLLAGTTPVGTAFTYQGQLKQSGDTVNGDADLRFIMYDALIGGAQVGAVLDLPGTPISDGLFTVTLDFGSGVFGTDARWLEIHVSVPAGSGIYSTLSPRQQIQSSPIAQFALGVNGSTITNLNASNIATGTLPNSALSGTYSGAVNFSNAGNTFAGNGASLTSLNASNLSAGVLGSGRLTGTYSNQVTFNNVANIYTGNGAGLLNLNASNIASGSLDAARLPSTGSWALSSFLNIDAGTLYVDPLFNHVGIGTASPSWPLHVTTTELNGIRVESTNAGGGQFIGGYFTVASTGGRAVYGSASAASGTTYGVHGHTASTAGRGVFGEATAAAGITYGGRFETLSGSGRGAFGLASAEFGTSYGLYGQSDSHHGYGVYGVATTTDPDSKFGCVGVAGEATSPNGSATGGRFTSQSVSGTGVLGKAESFTGSTVGVLGIAVSPDGYAGYFEGRGRFTGDLGVGVIGGPSGFRLDVQDSSLTSNIMNLERTADSASGSDMLQIVMGAFSADTTQFIECERGTDIKFRVWADGDVTADGTYTSPADFAELIRVSSGADSVEPGDVMIIDATGERAVIRSSTARSKLVAGVYSTKPGVLGSEHDWDQAARDLGFVPDENGEMPGIKPVDLGRMMNEIPMAMVGIVPCKVSAENGSILPGDLLVTSTMPGHAMRDENPRAGTIVGKSLGRLESGTGVIRVLVTLQ